MPDREGHCCAEGFFYEEGLVRNVHKACPVVVREGEHGLEVLAFIHPLAGKQIVKGGVEIGELPENAALRELAEESGITNCTSTTLAGKSTQTSDGQTWYFVVCESPTRSDTWTFFTADDGGHEFRFSGNL